MCPSEATGTLRTERQHERPRKCLCVRDGSTPGTGVNERAEILCLARQGKGAPGGAYDYTVRGKMIGGFAVLAYPARYRASGIMSFMVNHDGVVYKKDLGKNTAALAGKITAFDPDAGWKRP